VKQRRRRKRRRGKRAVPLHLGERGGEARPARNFLCLRSSLFLFEWIVV
jgi:hypothetical protein